MNELADEVWSKMITLVMDSRSDWRRQVCEVTGMPFSRVRVIRRLAGGPLSLRQIAQSATIDASAATLAVNDLEERGLVSRRISSGSRRTKDVALTAAGRRMIDAIDGVRDAAPPALCDLEPAELTLMMSILERIGDQGG